MKTIRRITAFILVFVMAFALAASGFAAHIDPYTGRLCNGVGLRIHGAYYTSGGGLPPHTVNGATCNRALQIFYHQITACLLCDAFLSGTELYACTTTHSICSDERNCN
jgi:hypothetical protein